MKINTKEIEKKNTTQLHDISEKHSNELKKLQVEINKIENDKYMIIQTLKAIDRILAKNRDAFWKEENFVENAFKNEVEKRNFHSFEAILT